ncbi:hypothetical protein [Comamonas composti]|uniref:hypothetical protein n=1 Tax=Comamonas composti TaxID=408558 RepID=UPI000412EB51|nr:hypothetical protein [Comamonas composti]
MNQSSSPNLDKLRNIVQRFGPHSFTTAQVASEYEDGPANAEATAQLESWLNRHATVLGIHAVSHAQGSVTVWEMA